MESTGALILTGIASGTLFGVAMEKAKVTLPIVIRDQMLFSRNIMLKMFMIGACTSIFCVTLAELSGWRQRKPKGPTSFGFGLNLKGYGSNVIGGLVLGVGMFLSGSCPGTVFAQIGSGVPGAMYTLLGGIVATVGYAYGYKYLESRGHGKKDDPVTLDKTFKTSVLTPAMLLMGVTAAVAIGFEKYVTPTSRDLLHLPGVVAYVPPPTFGWDFSATVWSPFSSGIIVGLTQIPAMLFAKDYLGTSASYAFGTGSICKLADKNCARNAPFFDNFTGPASKWQFGATIGILLGAYLSATESRFVPPPSPATPIESFVGGVLLLIGARVAGGCTSGHGISGMSQQSVASLITTAMMFGGAISTGLLYRALSWY